MLNASTIPSLPPPSSQPAASFDKSVINWENAIRPPPPASSRSYNSHSRSQSDVHLPPVADSPSRKIPRNSVHIPFLSSDRTSPPPRYRSRSPIKAGESSEQPPTALQNEAAVLTVDAKPFEAKPSKIASWFSGDSDRVNIGLVPSPTKEVSDPFSNKEEQSVLATEAPNEVSPLADDTPRPATATSKLQKRTSMSPTRPKTITSPSATSISRFFFKSKTNTPQSLSNTTAENDELLNLSIPASLFPQGPTDSFSPAAFKNLQMNAEGTLNRFQTAYRAVSESLRTTRSEKNIQADELEAAETRNEALKMQLSDMAARAVAQEEAMKQLKEELATERSRRQEEEELRKGTVKLVQPPEDRLRTYRGRRMRISDISNSSIESLEQDIDLSSEVSSVFSHSDQTTARSASPTTDTECSPATPHSLKFTPFNMAAQGLSKTLVPTQSTQTVKPECDICHGVSSSEAWGVMGVMKEESQALKGRITELEKAQEDCLNLLEGLGLQ
ncbi:MAG: hypothetical protein Q9227_002958 [Pyrenula ochraceoflavens]